MKVYFEELSRPKRAGGIEAACSQLAEQMRSREVVVLRSAETAWNMSGPLPDCIHIQGLWSPSLAKRFWKWKRLNVPCVISPHGMLEAWALSHKFWRKKFAWYLYQKAILNDAEVLHATSESEARQFERLGLTARAVVIPWGIQMPQEQMRQKREQSHRIAIFAGRLCPVKGLPMLIEAWKRVLPQGWRLKIIGPDENDYRANLEELVSTAGLVESITFEGEFSRSELQAAGSEAELFVLPSHSENFGMVVGEALAMGLPVLTTNATPWKRIADTKCGWWVPPQVDAITAALRQATSTSACELRAMGAIGSALVRDEFSWNTTTSKFLDLFESVVNPKSVGL